MSFMITISPTYFSSSFFLNIFLLGQGIYRSKHNIIKGKTKLYNECSITLN